MNNHSFDLMTISSMGVRITPFDRQPVHTSNIFKMQATSAETNVLNVSASLGLRTKVLTKFVEDSPIASFIQGELRKRGIAYEGPSVSQGGPWGYRHQFNIADSGFGVRGPRVQNDRAGEVGRTLCPEDFDFESIFQQEPCRIFHISGLIAALSETTTQACIAAAHAAKKSGAMVSFDLNYRESFWKGREDELRRSFREIASISDILIGNEEDFQLSLGIAGPEAGGKDLSDKINRFKEMILAVKAEYPNARTFSTTLRQVRNANEHLWGAILLHEDQWYVEEPRPISVLDRIGGGDGYVGGLLYAMLQNWDAEKWLQFGWATGALATTMLEDYASPVSEEQVWSIYGGNARVKR